MHLLRPTAIHARVRTGTAGQPGLSRADSVPAPVPTLVLFWAYVSAFS